MKKILLLIICAISFTGFSQDFKRFDVSGKIIVESNDVSGITIFNVTANNGTVTDNNGEFVLAVRLNDVIEVSALQFQNIKFEVNEAIVGSKKMKIFLIEEINLLDEIIIKRNKLTGNLDVDLEANKRFTPKLDALYFAIKNADEYDFKPDSKTKTENITVTTQQMTMKHGLNVVNVVDQLLVPLFRSKALEKKKYGIPEVPAEAVKYYFGSEFLIDNFDIPEHRVEEFIHFVQAKNFDYSFLNYGNEMLFLEFLHNKSIEFLNEK
ncbi:carboxypeptidase-like regulatory domain-containing protein [Mariniflexile sp.]|uniref:carboxypeptidase-like regulatory domain-containing protein n=1 Tax=Mariniflexile sp. TaxID=1979402 RepID=UPI0035689427